MANEATEGSLTDQHKTITVEYTYPRWDDNYGASASTTMEMACFANGRRRTGHRWYNCPCCMKALPADEVIWYKGRPLCKRCAADYIADDGKIGE
jgi:hypothetical protein